MKSGTANICVDSHLDRHLHASPPSTRGGGGINSGTATSKVTVSRSAEGRPDHRRSGRRRRAVGAGHDSHADQRRERDSGRTSASRPGRQAQRRGPVRARTATCCTVPWSRRGLRPHREHCGRQRLRRRPRRSTPCRRAPARRRRRILAPPTGYYKKGRILRLSRLDAVTNVNQPIKWRVDRRQVEVPDRRERPVLQGEAGQAWLVPRARDVAGDLQPVVGAGRQADVRHPRSRHRRKRPPLDRRGAALCSSLLVL